MTKDEIIKLKNKYLHIAEFCICMTNIKLHENNREYAYFGNFFFLETMLSVDRIDGYIKYYILYNVLDNYKSIIELNSNSKHLNCMRIEDNLIYCDFTNSLRALGITPLDDQWLDHFLNDDKEIKPLDITGLLD